jgi:outer membrane lipoprotein carrier protein
MQRKFLSWMVLPVLAAAACGRAEPAEGTHDSPRPLTAETPAAPAADPARGGAMEETGTVPAVELPAAEVETQTPGTSAQPAPQGQAGTVTQSEQQPAGANTADDILRRVERTYANVRSMDADFVQHLTVPLLNTSQRSEGRLQQRRPDRFAMRFTDPAGDIMVADGRHFWMYNPSVDRTQVLRTRIAEGGAEVDLQQQFLSNPTQRFVATLAGTEAVNGRPAHVLSLVPRGRSQYKLIRVWVDQQDNLVRRFEMTEENESVRRIELRNLRINVDLPDSAFQFTPPAGTQVFDQ